MNKNLDIIDIIQKGRQNYHKIQMGMPVYCPVTNEPLRVYWDGEQMHWDSPNTQKAHLLSSSKANYKKYGSKIIDHHYNWIFVSGLSANNSIQIKNNPELEQQIVREICEKLNSQGEC